MNKTFGIIALATLTTTGAMAADITPYVGLGIVADKAGTSAKRMGFDPMSEELLVQDGGGSMDFDMAIAGEFTAGIKFGHLRGEFEFALRSASEDDYELFSGDFGKIMGLGPNMIMGSIDTSTSVRHNSYMANFYYDFDIAGSKWQPYVGAGIGVGTYQQKAKVEPHMALNKDMLAMLPSETLTILAEEMEGINDPITVKRDRTAFEWQVALGAAYHFTPSWAADVAYRFNSSTISGEFVYAHEIKLGARYSF